jgi:hypothetical protein
MSGVWQFEFAQTCNKGKGCLTLLKGSCATIKGGGCDKNRGLTQRFGRYSCQYCHNPQVMKNFATLLLLILIAGCSKQRNDCSFPTFNCLQGKWIEKEHTAGSIQLKEYIQVYIENNREILYDWTAYAQLQMTQLAIGEYYFEELPHQDSVALTFVDQGLPYHRYLKMINENEIEIDYDLPPSSPILKKRYIRE